MASAEPLRRGAFALALLLAGGAACAQAGFWTVAELRLSFVRADSNRDGQLSRAEAQQLSILPRSFEELDANKDGVLTPQEYEAGAST